MLELSILAVIALAIVYWAALWLLGRHEDVLYGSFVTPPQSAAPEIPRKPMMLPPRPQAPATRLAGRRPEIVPPLTPQLSKPADSAALQRNARGAAPAPSGAVRADSLASLLETIKRDLNEAAGK
jgi:hypothetical protein